MDVLLACNDLLFLLKTLSRITVKRGLHPFAGPDYSRVRFIFRCRRMAWSRTIPQSQTTWWGQDFHVNIEMGDREDELLCLSRLAPVSCLGCFLFSLLKSASCWGIHEWWVSSFTGAFLVLSLFWDAVSMTLSTACDWLLRWRNPSGRFRQTHWVPTPGLQLNSHRQSAARCSLNLNRGCPSVSTSSLLLPTKRYFVLCLYWTQWLC